jgi:hypothetical protein
MSAWTSGAHWRKVMRNTLVLLVLCAGALAQDRPAAPAACGPKNVNFDVKLDESQHTVLPPEPGKARVYFIQDLGPITCIACTTTRFGLDGSWAGAVQHNGYFSVSVEPGEHHVCANPQSRFAAVNRVMALAHFTAEPGKVYYFRARAVGDRDNPFFDLDPIDSDQGEYFVASFPLSVFHPKP